MRPRGTLARALYLPRTVVVLGFVSMLNDSASEMVTPLLPLFLTADLGAGAAVVGLVEGVAEATSSTLKIASGWLADRGWSRKGLVISGYGLSNAARPLIGLALGWASVLVLRFLDRVGKGIRSSPRDALISAAVDQGIRGRAFGFQRALDHTGAVLGPLAAFALLRTGFETRGIFLISVLPGVLVVALLTAGLPRAPAPPAAAGPSPLRNWHVLDRRVRALILASGGLALATTPEVFLVLWAHDRGLNITWVPLVWAAAHGVKALVAVPAGGLSDRLGRAPVLILGWSARVLALAALALVGGGDRLTWALFLAYGAALASTEAPERALIGDFAPPHAKATAFGLYHMVCGVLALPGALVFGSLWQALGQVTAFLVAASMTALAALGMGWLTLRPPAGQAADADLGDPDGAPAA